MINFRKTASAMAIILTLNFATASAQIATQTPTPPPGCSLAGDGWTGEWEYPFECKRGMGPDGDIYLVTSPDGLVMRIWELEGGSPEQVDREGLVGYVCEVARGLDGEEVIFESEGHTYLAATCSQESAIPFKAYLREYWQVTPDLTLTIEIGTPEGVDAFNEGFASFVMLREGISLDTDEFNDDPVPFDYEVD